MTLHVIFYYGSNRYGGGAVCHLLNQFDAKTYFTIDIYYLHICKIYNMYIIYKNIYCILCSHLVLGIFLISK